MSKTDRKVSKRIHPPNKKSEMTLSKSPEQLLNKSQEKSFTLGKLIENISIGGLEFLEKEGMSNKTYALHDRLAGGYQPRLYSIGAILLKESGFKLPCLIISEAPTNSSISHSEISEAIIPPIKLHSKEV